MNMMSNATRGRLEAPAHAAAIQVVTYDSPYGKFTDAVIERIRRVEGLLTEADIRDRKTPLPLLTEEENRLSTKLIKLEVAKQSRGSFVELVAFRPEYSNLVEDLEVVAKQNHPEAQKALKDLLSWREHIDYWAGQEA